MAERQNKLDELRKELEGELLTDDISRIIYSTDASVYREVPEAVAYPLNEQDLVRIIRFSATNQIPVTMRAAGTSLAGQATGGGIIVDVSRHMNSILEINREEKWVRVQPGVVLDELNKILRKEGLFFGPETSTSNRCNIGGMAGNNACGLHSLIYGSTRDHTLEMRAVLSDGSVALFSDIDREVFSDKCKLSSLEGDIYRGIKEILEDQFNKNSIHSEFPDPAVHRRNTGYAIDLLLDTELFTSGSEKKFNFCKLLSGSEGTLAAISEIKLNLIPLPPANKALVCVHLLHRNEAFRANLVALKHNPSAVELMDDRILELTRDNITQRKNRFFVEGNPGGILIVEFLRDSAGELDRDCDALIQEIKKEGFGYAWPVIRGRDIQRVWDLRKAGLGVLSNMKGDAKPVTLIEDTAIPVEQLPEYMEELEALLGRYGKDAVYHAHIGTGELHIRPVINLKDPADVEIFRNIGRETAMLVKKYRGSISGEHGDGRLRGEFIPLVIGDHNYKLLRAVKKCWDPASIMNPGKIIDTAPMNSSLRYEPGAAIKDIKTFFDFSSTGGVIRAAENCNGSGDCRKSVVSGGVMCPSYMATGEEKNTTRARANILRECLSRPENNPWDHREIYEILDLCLSCKGCKSECPSNVDIAKLKAEFLQHWYDRHGIPLRTLAVAWISSINRLGSAMPALFNYFASSELFSGMLKKLLGFARERSIPLLYSTTLRGWIRKNPEKLKPERAIGRICLFVDEFTNYNDTATGIKAVGLLTSLGYEVIVTDHGISGRTFLSKGLIRKASSIARRNVEKLSQVISDDLPLVGIEPSALLCFRDEYPELVGPVLKAKASDLASRSFLLDEFLSRELEAKRIGSEQFTSGRKEVLVHTHCQQKSLSGSLPLLTALSIPSGYSVREISSGCCGMAGSFGYEKEHFVLSNRIGELVLFPEVRSASDGTIIAAPGTSCRHHIKDGTGHYAFHPADILYDALKR